jgi:hypothetical protein
MTTGNAHKYTVEELLRDDRFIASVIRPAAQAEDYWNRALEEGLVQKHDYELACYFIRSVQVHPEPIRPCEIESLWEDIEIRNKKNLRRQTNRFRLYSAIVSGVAVSLLCLAVLPGRMPQPSARHTSGIEHVKAPDVQPADIQLVLSGDKTLSLEGKEAEIAYREEGIAINNRETELEHTPAHPDSPVVYNQLIVPLGKRSMLTFAEGSRMWVNAGTRVVYPAVFGKEQREIYVDGEAYIEVSPASGCPFVVRTKELSVEALGTSFNVMAYENDTVRNIVLVSGAVKIHPGAGRQEAILAPNEMYLSSGGLLPEVKKVNVDNYIAWKSGAYQYESETMDVILKRLSRYYGMKIEYSGRVALLRCSGKLDLKDDLRSVLEGISRTAPIICRRDGEHYTVTNK